MSTAKYPNRDALREANDIYLDAMRPFILHYLRRVLGETVEYLIERALTDEQVEDFRRELDEDGDIESAIDFSYIPLIVKRNWLITRNSRNYGFGEQFNMDMTLQSMLWLIRKGRNSCEHRGTKDLDSEFVRINLYFIANVLGKTNRSDKQCEVEDIRDKLFSDDTSERLAEAEAKNAEYKKSLSEVEKRLEAAEGEKTEYKEHNATLSNQVDEKERHFKKLSKQLKRAKTERDKNKKTLATTKKRLEKSEAAQADYKASLETKSKELKRTEAERCTSAEHLVDTSNQLAQVQAEKKGIMERLSSMQDLFTTATLEKPQIRSIFPALDTDTPVRILDRRGTDKRNYLLGLLEQKQPTIIYVQSEEKIDLLLKRVLPEKVDVIGRHDERTSDAQEMEILEKLENGELVAVVSNATFSALTSSHCVEHFVCCHLVPDLDKFFKRCEPAFISAKNAYLHLIYESKQDVEELAEKYPKKKDLRNLYEKFRGLTPVNGEFINPENLYSELCKESELDMTKLGIGTGFSIFEELGFLEQSEEGIRRLPTTPTGLEESEIYCRGEKLKKETVNCPDFQYEQSIERIWKEIRKELNVENEQVIRESSIDKIPSDQHALRDSQTQAEQSAASIESESTVGEETVEARPTPTPPRSNAKVTEEQVREIRSRSAAGESNSKLAKEFGLTPPAVRNIVMRNTWKHVE